MNQHPEWRPAATAGLDLGPVEWEIETLLDEAEVTAAQRNIDPTRITTLTNA